MFMGILISILNASNHTKWVLLKNQKSMIQPTHINLYPNKCCREFRHNPFAVKLDRCVGTCNALNGLTNKAYVPIKTDLNLSLFNMITGINKSKVLAKYISC